MARKSKHIKIDTGDKSTNRDFGKIFVLMEMPAMQAEKWAARAFMALARSGVDLPADVSNAGMAGIAFMGLRALAVGGIHFEDIEPLLDEMLGCIKIVRDPKTPEMTYDLRMGVPGAEDDIEEVATLIKLRQEVFDLHVNFSQADVS